MGINEVDSFQHVILIEQDDDAVKAKAARNLVRLLDGAEDTGMLLDMLGLSADA